MSKPEKTEAELTTLKPASSKERDMDAYPWTSFSVAKQ